MSDPSVDFVWMIFPAKALPMKLRQTCPPADFMGRFGARGSPAAT